MFDSAQTNRSFGLNLTPRECSQQPLISAPTRGFVSLFNKGFYVKKISHSLSLVVFAVAALTSVVGCASTATQESTGQYVDDTVITGRVKTAIFNDASLKSAEINVETFKGVVQLSGFVNSTTDIQRAVQLVQGINGVRSVRNDMRLK